MISPKELEAYQQFNLQIRLNDAKIAYILLLILVPAGYLLDYIYYSDYLKELIIIRSVSVIFLLALFAYSHTSNFYKKTWLVGLAWPLVINIAFSLMIFITDGLDSPYYAGLNLVLVGAGFMALTVQESILILFATLILYVLAVTLHGNGVTTENFKLFFANFYFIFLTGIIGATASYVKGKQRFREFSLRYELDNRNKELAELDRIKSDFFANISHELRTPLTLILSPLEDLLQSKQPLDFKVNQLLSTVRNNSYRLLKLVNDLLTIIKLDESNTCLQCKPLDINPLLRSVVQSMQHMAKKQEIKLKTNIDIQPTIINAEVSALEKIFINLLNNAIKFTPPSGVITVNSNISQGRVIITFKDTGIGISEKDLPHIFDRFKQADSSTTRKYQGTGLGLALVKELTHALNGKVKVTSELNKGTSIRLLFPLFDEGDLEFEPSPVTLTEKSSNPLEALHQKADYSLPLNKPNTERLEPTLFSEKHQDRPKLLIVEDEPDLRSYLVNALSNNYQVYSAADGAVGLEQVMKHEPDLILLDLMLPKIDGLQLCKKIKNEERLRFSKVVLLTARIDEESKMSALENGADDFLTKPFSTIEVRTRLDNLWKSNQLERDLEKHNKELEQALADLKAMESKLIHSEKLSAIGSLAAGLLHEVNNPLNYAITAVQMLQRDPEIKKDGDLIEMVDDIFEGMERIQHIVKDLHTFAYPDTGDKTQAFRLSDAIESSLRFTASEHKGITINDSVPEDLIVIGSNTHIVQVLINLITNASKALSSVSEPTISIKAEPLENSTRRILISIRDNGIGISEENQSRVFDPFFTTRDVGDGLGMGLSICYTIIQNHDSTLNVTSEVGKYTEFSFDLETA